MAFNVVVCGIGGRGVVALARLLAHAAMREGRSVVMSEVHGLAMRFGHLEAHVRFATRRGEELHCPVVAQGGAQLLLGLEPLEALRAAIYAARGAKALIDDWPSVPSNFYVERLAYPSVEEIIARLREQGVEVFVENASAAARAVTGSPAGANVYLAGRALALGALPLKAESLRAALAAVLPARALEANQKLFEVALARGTQRGA